MPAEFPSIFPGGARAMHIGDRIIVNISGVLADLEELIERIDLDPLTSWSIADVIDADLLPTLMSDMYAETVITSTAWFGRQVLIRNHADLLPLVEHAIAPEARISMFIDSEIVIDPAIEARARDYVSRQLATATALPNSALDLSGLDQTGRTDLWIAVLVWISIKAGALRNHKGEASSPVTVPALATPAPASDTPATPINTGNMHWPFEISRFASPEALQEIAAVMDARGDCAICQKPLGPPPWKARVQQLNPSDRMGPVDLYVAACHDACITFENLWVRSNTIHVASLSTWLATPSSVMLGDQLTPTLVFRPVVESIIVKIDSDGSMTDVLMQSLVNAGWKPFTWAHIQGESPLTGVPASSHVKVQGSDVTVKTSFDHWTTDVEPHWMQLARKRGGFAVVITRGKVPDGTSRRIVVTPSQLSKAAQENATAIIEGPMQNPGAVGAFVPVR